MEWYWYIILVVVLYLLQNTIHEGSHLLTAWITEGRRPLAFWPFVHRYKKRWYFARCVWGYATKPNASAKYKYFSPVVAGNITLFVWVCMLPGRGVDTKLFWLALFGASFALFDVLFWIYGYVWGTEQSDGKRYRKAVLRDGVRIKR